MRSLGLHIRYIHPACEQIGANVTCMLADFYVKSSKELVATRRRRRRSTGRYQVRKGTNCGAQIDRVLCGYCVDAASNHSALNAAHIWVERVCKSG